LFPRPAREYKRGRAKESVVIKGEGTEVIQGVTIDEVFDFVLDPAQYTKADTKIIWVTKLADIDNGMIGLEEGKFFGLFKGAVVTRYEWSADHTRLDVKLINGLLKSLHAWFDFEQTDEGVRIHHAETMEMAFGPFGMLLELGAKKWLADSVRQEVREIKRLMEPGERGKGP
jgi:hypothetical protein